MINRKTINILIERFFASRVMRNVTFWIFFGLLNIYNYTILEGSKLFETLSIFQIFLIFSSRFFVYAPLVYFNNLILLPNFLNQRKYILYIVSIAALIVSGLFYIRFTVYQITTFIPQLDSSPKMYPPAAYVFSAVTFILGFTMSKYAYDFYNKKQNEQILHKENLLSELDVLKSQVNPHFLFNALNTIYGLSIKNSEDTSNSIMQLSNILRYNLYECNTDQVLLSKEIEYLENYLEFAKLRRNKAARIEYSKKGDLSHHKIAPLLLIPFIENSFKHGLDKNIKNAWVNISIQIAENELTFICGNSRSEVDNETTKVDSGIGLQNVRRRLDLIYGKNYKLAIKQDALHYSTILKLDLESNNSKTSWQSTAS